MMSLLSVVPLASAAQPQSKVCHFYEKPLTQEYIAQLSAYDVLETQEQIVSSRMSSAASGFGLEIAGRSPSARQTPTDFVVLRIFSCAFPADSSATNALEGSICHRSEGLVQDFAVHNATDKIKTLRVNKPYRKLRLLGREQGHRLKTVGRKRAVNEPARELFGLRQEPTLLVDDLGVRELWERGYKGQGVKVGIFDTGLSSSRLTNVKERINWTHEPKNEDSVGHGTFVAGVVSGTDAKCPGIAPEAELFVFRMFTAEQLSFTSWYLDAFNYALFKGIHVLNLSTGGPDFQDLPFVDKVKELAANGIILVSAVGNDGPHYGLVSNPADQAEVIGVGGITKNNEIAEFSSRGMTTWELPFGSGRVKPDIVTLAEDVPVNNGGQVDELLIPLIIKIIPTPPASKRILWDQFHNIPYPSAFVPRDNLENQHDLMDVSGDHPHTNFHQLWNFLTSEGFFMEIMPFEYSCLDLGKYGVVMVVDPEEEFFRDEIVALQAAVKYSNVSLIVFADWYDNRMLDSLELFDTSTLSKWHAITGGANIPAINELLHDFHIAFGDGVIYSSSVSLLDAGNDTSFPYWSGSYLTNFPVGGYLGYIDAVDQSARTLNGSDKTLTDVPVLGLYQVPSHYGGRIAVFGDSSCLDSSVHPAAKFRDCFGMLRSILRFTNEAILPSSIAPQDDSASTGLQRLELEFVADKSRLHPLVDMQDEDIWHLRARHSEFAKHSKVLQASEGKSIHRNFCKFYAKQQCVEG
ncbi:hypothetical protein PRNP1_009433 [Phytophthora ramorum]